MGKINIKKLIVKYSWLLILYYIFSSGFPNIPIYGTYFMTDYLKFSAADTATFFIVRDILTYLINLMIALIMYLDYRRYKIKNVWTIVLTLIYIPIGLVVFFINIYYSQNES